MEGITEIAKPDWLELSEPEKQEHTYWACEGNWTGETQEIIAHREETWLIIFHSKEEAEANACIPDPHWKWDRKPASQMTLPEAMSEARSDEQRGVRICGYQDGQWVYLKEYPVEVPLIWG